jgi:hypothetical protein
MKSSVHHSRDSPLKQWSETRVLAIRGLLRLVRSCVKVIMLQSWFVDLWNEILSISVGVVFSSVATLEQSGSSIDLYFGMIYITTESNVDNICSPSEVERIERRKQELWSSCLSYLPSICLCATSFPDLTISVCQKLAKLYTERKDAEFRYSENMKLLCWSISALSRPVHTSLNKGVGFSNEAQLIRSVLELLKIVQIHDGNRSVMETYISALLEIILAVQSQHVTSSKLTHGQEVMPATETLRKTIREVCFSSLLDNKSERSKIGLHKRFFLGLLTRQFLESIGNQRIEFFSYPLREQFQKYCNPSNDARSIDRVIPVLNDNNNADISHWYFFFSSYPSILSLFSEALTIENLQDSLRSTESEIGLSISLALILSPWPSSSNNTHENYAVDALSSEFSSFMKVIMDNAS